MAFKLFKSKKEKIGFAIFFISIVVIPVLIFAAKQVNDIRQRAFEAQSIPPTDQATLGFSYNEPFYGRPIAVDQTFGVTLEIDSPLDITAIESFINFDPNILEVVKISDITKDGFVLNASSSAYSRPPLFQHAQIVKSDFSNTQGTINYAILASPTEDYTQYRSNIAYYGEVIFKAKQVGNTTITYNQNSAIAAKGFGSQNVLSKTLPITLEFTDKPQTAQVPIIVKFASLNTNIPSGLTITALVTVEGENNNIQPWQTISLKPSGAGKATGLITLPFNKNFKITLNRPGFLDSQVTGYMESANPDYRINASNQPLIPGDIDPNGIINIFDYGLFVEDFGKTTPVTPPNQLLPSDLDFSGKVNIFDYGIFVDNFGKGSNPNPKTISFNRARLDINTNDSFSNLKYFILFVNFTMPKSKSGKITGSITETNNPCTGTLTGDSVYESNTTSKFTGSFTGNCRLPGGNSIPATGTFQGTYWSEIGYLKGTWKGKAGDLITAGTLYIGDIQSR